MLKQKQPFNELVRQTPFPQHCQHSVPRGFD